MILSRAMFDPIHRHHLAGFALDFALMAAYTALPFYAYNQLGGDERMSGTIAAALSFSYMTACLLIGLGIVRLGGPPLRIASLGTLVFAIALPIASFAFSPVVFTLFGMLAFGAVALSWPAMHAWLGGERDLKRRSRIMSNFNIAWSLGMALGSLLAGPMYVAHFRLPFLVAAGFGGIAALILFFQPREETFFHGDFEVDTTHDVPRGAEHLYAAWIAVFLGFFVLGAARAVYPKHLNDLTDIQAVALLPNGGPISYTAPTLFSFLAFAITFSSAVVYFVMGRTTWWHGRYAHVVAIQCCVAVGCYVVAYTHSVVVMFICYTLFGTGTYIAFFMSAFYCMSDPQRKKQRAAINESLVGGGGLIGAVSCGWLASISTIPLVFAWMPVAVLTLIAIQLVVVRLRRKPRISKTV